MPATAPTEPTAVQRTVSASKRTVSIADDTELASYLAGTFSSVPTWGDDVALALGTYSPASPHTLPAASVIDANGGTQTGNDYITFRSVNLSSLPAAGTRVSTSDSTNMPRLNTPSGANGFFICADHADHYRFQGLNITAASNVHAAGLLMLQSVSSAADSTTHPDHMIVERCLLHGDPTMGCNQGIQATGSDITIVDNMIYDVMSTFAGNAGPPSYGFNEDHGILISGGTGPYLVHNNYVEADSCNVFVGDSLLSNAGIIPSDITVTKNYLRKSAAWNPYSNIYEVGTASTSADGLTVTLATGTPDSAWTDGTYYLGIRSGASWLNVHPNITQLITGVNVGAKTITLSSAVPGANPQTSLTYRITKYSGTITINQFKNFFEAKHGNRIKIDSNVMDLMPQGGQNFAMNLISMRGIGASGTDYIVTNNRIKNAAQGVSITCRPTQATNSSLGSGIASITNNGGFCQLNFSNVHNSATGDTAVITGVSTGAAINGTHTITYVDTDSFTIPVSYASGFTNGTGGVVIYNAGTPVARVLIENNLFEDTSALDVMAGDGWKDFINISVNPVLGGSDASASTTGTWAMKDVVIRRNSIVGPSTQPDLQAAAIKVTNPGDAAHNTVWQSENFTVSDNVWKMTASSFGNYGGLHYANSDGSVANGSAGFDLYADSSRSITNNAWFVVPVISTPLTNVGDADDTNNAVVAGDTNIGFTSYATGSIANYALTNLWTGTCDVSGANPCVLTNPSVNFPSTIVKGTPFKVNSDGTYKLVESRDSATQITLQTGSVYPTTGNTLTCTLGFKGWSTDGADPGANMTTLAAALTGVEAGTPDADSGDRNPAVGAMALVGIATVVGIGLMPQTP